MKKSIKIVKDISTLPIINGKVDNVNIDDVLHYKESFPYISVHVNNANIAGSMYVSIDTLLCNKYAVICEDMIHEPKGKFIVFESLDNVAIDKQIGLYYQYLISNNIKAVIVDGHNIDIDVINNETVVNAMYKLYDANTTISDYIDNGYVVICNKWVYNTLSYFSSNSDMFNSILLMTNSLLLPNRIVYINTELDVMTTLDKSIDNEILTRRNTYEYIIKEDSDSYDLIRIINNSNIVNSI